MLESDGRLAQLGERSLDVRKVAGSIPVPSTPEPPMFRGFFVNLNERGTNMPVGVIIALAAFGVMALIAVLVAIIAAVASTAADENPAEKD